MLQPSDRISVWYTLTSVAYKRDKLATKRTLIPAQTPIQHLHSVQSEDYPSKKIEKWRITLNEAAIMDVTGHG